MRDPRSTSRSIARPAPWLVAALLTLGPLALHPALAQTQPEGGYSYQDEVKLEQTCKEWQKVRRCADAQGEVKLECVSKSPFAKLWSMLRGRSQDDEVRVEVVRKAPEGMAASAKAVEGQAQVSATGEARTKRVVRKGELPACGGDR